MDNVQIANLALIGLGCEPISSFDEGTTEATVISATFDALLNATLSSYPWRFCTVSEDIARLNAETKSGFKYVYQLPNNFLRAIALVDRGDDADFGIVGNTLVTDAEAPTLTYTAKVPPEQLPDYFIEVFVDKLQAKNAIALTGDKAMGTYFQRCYDSDSVIARSRDAQQATTQVFTNDILLDCRK